MSKQLARFVENVVEDILKKKYPHLVEPSILLARVSNAVDLTGSWTEYTLTVVDRFGIDDSDFPTLPGVRSKVQLDVGDLAAIALPYGDLRPAIIGEVLL